MLALCARAGSDGPRVSCTKANQKQRTLIQRHLASSTLEKTVRRQSAAEEMTVESPGEAGGRAPRASRLGALYRSLSIGGPETNQKD